MRVLVAALLVVMVFSVSASAQKHGVQKAGNITLITGGVMTVTGISMFIAGISSIIEWDEYTEAPGNSISDKEAEDLEAKAIRRFALGSITTGVGVTCLITAIPLRIVGRKLSRKTSFDIEPTFNGMRLTYDF